MMHSDRVYWSLRAIDFVLFRLNQGLTCFHEASEREFFPSLEESEIMEEKIEVSFIQENFEEKSIFQKRREIWINWIMFLRECTARSWIEFEVLKTGWARSWQVLHQCSSPQRSTRKFHFNRSFLNFDKWSAPSSVKNLHSKRQFTSSWNFL